MDAGGLIFLVAVFVGIGVLGFLPLAALVFYFTFLDKGKKEVREAAPALKKDSLVDTLRQARIYTITLPKETVWQPERAGSLLDHLLANFGGVLTLRILSEPGGVSWQIIDSNKELSEVEPGIRAIQAIYPEAEVMVSDYEPYLPESPIWRGVIMPKLHNPFFMPLKSVAEIKSLDPLSALVEAMSGLSEGNRVVYTLHISGAVDQETWQRGVKQIQHSEQAQAVHFGLQMVGAMLSKGATSYQPMKGTGRTGKGRYVAREQELYEHKLYDQSLAKVHLLVQMDATDRQGFDHAVNIFTVLGGQFSTNLNAWVPDEKAIEERETRQVETEEEAVAASALGLIAQWSNGSNVYWERAEAVLSTEELAALWHLPHQGFTSNEIVWQAGRRALAPAAVMRNTTGVLIGNNVFSGSTKPIRVPDKDRNTHINIVGRTGVGKSTFMHNLIHQDIADGKGVGVIDPHGSLVRNVLRTSVPGERVDDVIVIDISYEKYPPPLNPMATPGKKDSMAAGQVVAVLDKIYGGILNTPRIADTLTAALVTLWKAKTPTVRDVVRLFRDIDYRRHFLSQVDDVVTLEFWEEFERQSPSVQRDLSYPVIHRMRKFYGNPHLYPMMCHPEALDFAKFIAERKIVLVSLGVGEEKVPGPEQQLLGAVLVSQLQMAAMQSLNSSTPFYLYVDEVQNFVTTALDKVLSEALKFGLRMTIANQYLGQLSGGTLNAVMGNVGASIVFQIGLKDARLLAPYFKPEFEATDLVQQDLYNAAVKMRFEGRTLPAFSLVTRPRPGQIDSDQAKRRESIIRKRSVQLYTPRSREEVLAWLARRYPRPDLPRSTSHQDDTDRGWIVSPN
jgi:hypothetical protein